jgi:hypothetical protein
LWEGSEDWQGLKFHFDGMLRSLEGWITENAPTFRRIGSEIAAAIVDGIQDALTPDFVKAIKEGDWERAIGELDKLLSGTNVLPPITSSGGMGDLAEWEQAVEALMAGLAPTRAQGKALLQKFREHGIQISDGLAMGLETGILVTRQIAELNGILIGNDLTTGTKNALRIGSPSLVYRDIGADVIAGLAQGISTFLPNLNSVVSAMVNIFINAASQITSVMNTIRMQVFQIQGYMQTVQNSQMQAQLAYQQAQQAAMISAAQKTASAASTIGSAFTGSPLIPPVNQIIVNTQPQTTSTTTTNLNTTVSGVTMSTEDEAAYVIERTLRSVKGGLVSWN